MSVSNVRRLAIDGLWSNPSGAELALTQRGALIGGTYRTHLGEARLGKAYPVTGWRDGRCLGFSVSWAPESDSLTTWAGLLGLNEAGETVIDATFLLVSGSMVRDRVGLAVKTDTEAWEAFRTQSVRFTRAAR